MEMYEQIYAIFWTEIIMGFSHLFFCKKFPYSNTSLQVWSQCKYSLAILVSTYCTVLYYYCTNTDSTVYC